MENYIYSKPTDSHLYLHNLSCHQKQSIKGIQKGVALCLRRICSSDQEYENRSKDYMAYLVARGHDPFHVKKYSMKQQIYHEILNEENSR